MSTCVAMMTAVHKRRSRHHFPSVTPSKTVRRRTSQTAAAMTANPIAVSSFSHPREICSTMPLIVQPALVRALIRKDRPFFASLRADSVSTVSLPRGWTDSAGAAVSGVRSTFGGVSLRLLGDQDERHNETTAAATASAPKRSTGSRHAPRWRTTPRQNIPPPTAKRMKAASRFVTLPLTVFSLATAISSRTAKNIRKHPTISRTRISLPAVEEFFSSVIVLSPYSCALCSRVF